MTKGTIYVTSTNPLKIQCVEKINNATHRYERVIGIDCATTSTIAQPVSYGDPMNNEIVECARQRTETLLSKPCQFGKDDVIVSIENGIVKKGSDYVDVCCVRLDYIDPEKQKMQGNTFYYSEGIQLRPELAEDYFASYYKYGKTFGDYLHDLFDVDPKDWMADSRFGNCRRIVQIEHALVQAFIDDATLRIPDYPKKGVLFKDMNPIFENVGLKRLMLDQAVRILSSQLDLQKVDYFVGLQSRGYPLASSLQDRLEKPLILLRKLSSNPHKNSKSTISANFTTEYSEDAFSLSKNPEYEGKTCVLVDDLVATGGSFTGAIEVLKQAGMRTVAVITIYDVEQLRDVRQKKMSDFCPCFTIVQPNNTTPRNVIKPLMGIKLHPIAQQRNEPWLQVQNLDKNHNVVMSASASSRDLATAIAKWIGTDVWNTVTSNFASGETNVRIVAPNEDSIKNKNVILVCSPAINRMVQEFDQLVHLIDACSRSNAAKIIVVLPYYLNARSDKKDSPGVPIGAAITAKYLSCSVPIQVISLHLHAPQIQALIPTGFHNLSPKRFFGDFIRENYLTNGKDKYLLVAPDAGALKMVGEYSVYLGMDDPCFVSKKRNPETGKIDKMVLYGTNDCSGKTAIIIDDMGDSFGTMFGVTDFLVKQNVERVIIVVSHGLFTGNAIDKIKNHPYIDAVITSNSLPQYDNIEKCRKIIQIDMSKLFAAAASGCVSGKSLGKLFTME